MTGPWVVAGALHAYLELWRLCLKPTRDTTNKELLTSPGLHNEYGERSRFSYSTQRLGDKLR